MSAKRMEVPVSGGTEENKQVDQPVGVFLIIKLKTEIKTDAF